MIHLPRRLAILGSGEFPLLETRAAMATLAHGATRSNAVLRRLFLRTGAAPRHRPDRRNGATELGIGVADRDRPARPRHARHHVPTKAWKRGYFAGQAQQGLVPKGENLVIAGIGQGYVAGDAAPARRHDRPAGQRRYSPSRPAWCAEQPAGFRTRLTRQAYLLKPSESIWASRETES